MVSAVVLLSIPALLLACSTLPPGQEARVGFLVQELSSIPMQFATSADQTTWGTKFPNFAPSAAEATKNVQKAVKKALMQVIKEEANRAGIGHLAADIAQQIKPTVRYTPMNCVKVNTEGAGPAANPNDFECTVAKDAITNVKSNGQDAPIPANYREFMVNLLISNYVIGGWGRDRWQLTLMKTEKLLRKDKTYGPSFKTASVELLYP
ncbi:hypothetical protein ANCCAN_12186 [Ancylostoma caninum]|uniref:Uncharacterized protein n=1 Tax=Ancylostoma caninum TaxID=29170 RepID=A0A368GDX3_ANCCA|nr:hypothetical protein ANCCAN_12186 [Ancylostoma caninum]